jgi:hypothetical protein
MLFIRGQGNDAMMRRIAVLILIFAIAMSLPAHAYTIDQSREQLLAKYYADVEPKIPPSARMLVGDERINAYIGNQTFGAVVVNGDLESFDYSLVDNPTITIRVTDYAADSISDGQMGIMDAINNGGITIQTSNLLSALKVAVMERIYAASGYDKRLTQGNGMIDDSQPYVQTTNVMNSLSFW